METGKKDWRKDDMKFQDGVQVKKGMLLSICPSNVDEIQSCMDDFCRANANSGLPVQSAYDEFGRLLGPSALRTKFYQNVALSNWDDVKSSYSVQEHVLRLNEGRREAGLSELDEMQTGVALAGQILELEQSGLRHEHVRRVLDKSIHDEYVDVKYLGAVTELAGSMTDEQLDVILDNTESSSVPVFYEAYRLVAGKEPDEIDIPAIRALDAVHGDNVVPVFAALLYNEKLSSEKALHLAEQIGGLVDSGREETAMRLLQEIDGRKSGILVGTVSNDALRPYEELIAYTVADAEPELVDPEEKEEVLSSTELADRMLTWAENYDTYGFEDARDGKDWEELIQDTERELASEKLFVGAYQYIKEALDEMEDDKHLVPDDYAETKDLLAAMEQFGKSKGYDLSVDVSAEAAVDTGKKEEMHVEPGEAFADPDETLDTNHVIAAISTAQSMTNPQDFHFSSPGADVQIDIRGLIIEPAWEDFAPSVAVYENGDLLYLREASNAGSYHQETYTQGRFASLDEVEAYLQETYKDVSDWERVLDVYPLKDTSYPRRWENPSYARDYERMHSDHPEDYLDRIVFEDKGPARGRDGQLYHRVDFAYACDQKTFGTDENMPNPYLLDAKRKGSDGKLTTTHSYYLSEPIYRRLMDYANTSGLNDSHWTGVIAAEVTYPTSRVGVMKRSVNLTEKAVQDVKIATPAQPFDEKAHDKFVKRSMAAMYAAKEKEKGTESRPLPTVSDRTESVQKSDKGLGED